VNAKGDGFRTSHSPSRELRICRNSGFASWLVNAVRWPVFDFEKFERRGALRRLWQLRGPSTSRISWVKPQSPELRAVTLPI